MDVLVDDDFPCTMYGTLAYTSAARRQLWVALLEKAAAKLHGCYEAMTGGSVAEALALFTGFPTERIMLDKLQGRANAQPGGSSDADFLWVKLMSFHEVGSYSRALAVVTLPIGSFCNRQGSSSGWHARARATRVPLRSRRWACRHRMHTV